MNNLNYYKSLISDDEVISALVRESRAREGNFEKTRVRPNMNFFQRTVSHMVSSNQRISSRQERKIAEEKKKNKTFRSKKYNIKKRTAQDLIKEILTSQRKFIPSTIPEDMNFETKSHQIIEGNNSSSFNQEPTNGQIEKVLEENYNESSIVISSDDEEFTKNIETMVA